MSSLSSSLVQTAGLVAATVATTWCVVNDPTVVANLPLSVVPLMACLAGSAVVFKNVIVDNVITHNIVSIYT